MKKSEVLDLLKDNQDERGIKNWKERYARDSGLKSFGIGLTKLRKLAKQVGKDPALAKQLWKSKVYDAKVIALLIDDPKKMTIEQAEEQVEEVGPGQLTHVFATCGAPLAKTSFVVELADKWMVSNDDKRRDCGFGLLYEIAKMKTKNAPDDPYFLEWVNHINEHFDGEDIPLKMSMGTAIMGIGVRNKKLNKAALKVAKRISPIDFDPDGTCDPFDIVKHLTGDFVQQRFKN